MISSLAARLDAAIAALPRAYPGPGGAVAVLREGTVLARHAWGWANAERRIPFTAQTLFRMCSITKQFTCGVLLDAFADPSVLDGEVRARLPRLEDAAPGARDLCHNQSGMRDYWALAMLHGAPAESAFGDTEAAKIVAGIRSLQFAPGTRYSYVNQNFRMLSEIVEQRTGRGFGELLRRRIFEPAGMGSAILAADTRAMPDGTEGYEGNATAGFRAAENRIVWSGDAGLGASLDDMVAWEKFIDRGRDDAGSLHSRLSVPVTFADGHPAPYGFGLHRGVELGRSVIGHGGALRGWRSHRMYLPAERISVVVMFNHLSDAHDAAVDLLAAVLGEARPAVDIDAPLPVWAGAYIEPQTGLSARIDAGPPGHVRLRFGHSAERLALQADGTAGTLTTRLRPSAEGVWLDRPQENFAALLRPLEGAGTADVTGRFVCDELDADVTVVNAGGALYGGFSGFLGQGRMELLEPIGPDVWALPCPRALDHTPPGDWTLWFRRDGSGRVAEVSVGCWLARGLRYVRASS
jgi:D-aminopeptidase